MEPSEFFTDHGQNDSSRDKDQESVMPDETDQKAQCRIQDQLPLLPGLLGQTKHTDIEHDQADEHPEKDILPHGNSVNRKNRIESEPQQHP